MVPKFKISSHMMLILFFTEIVTSRHIFKRQSLTNKRAVADIKGDVSGRLIMTEEPHQVTIEGEIRGLIPGYHGFHIHEFGDLSEDCQGAGSHFNPLELPHGGPTDTQRHNGDLGNILANKNGEAKVNIKDSVIRLNGASSIIGRSFVVHQNEDDLGKGGNDESLKTGNAGPRVGCAVIGIAKLF